LQRTRIQFSSLINHATQQVSAFLSQEPKYAVLKNRSLEDWGKTHIQRLKQQTRYDTAEQNRDAGTVNSDAFVHIKKRTEHGNPSRGVQPVTWAYPPSTVCSGVQPVLTPPITPGWLPHVLAAAPGVKIVAASLAQMMGSHSHGVRSEMKTVSDILTRVGAGTACGWM
jgi:hypothetical protein